MTADPSNRELADAIDQVHQCVEDKFAALNKAAWKALGAVALAFLVGVISIIATVISNGLSSRAQASQIQQTAAQAATVAVLQAELASARQPSPATIAISPTAPAK